MSCSDHGGLNRPDEYAEVEKCALFAEVPWQRKCVEYVNYTVKKILFYSIIFYFLTVVFFLLFKSSVQAVK